MLFSKIFSMETWYETINPTMINTIIKKDIIEIHRSLEHLKEFISMAMFLYLL